MTNEEQRPQVVVMATTACGGWYG